LSETDTDPHGLPGKLLCVEEQAQHNGPGVYVTSESRHTAPTHHKSNHPSSCKISFSSHSTQHPSPPLSLPRIIPRHNTIHTILIILLVTPSLLLISQRDPRFLISSFEWDSVVFVVWWGEREVGLRAGEGCCGRDGLAWCRVIWVRGRLTEVCSVCDPCCRMSRSAFEREGSLRRTNSETEERSDGHVLPMMSIVGRSRDSNHGTSKQRGKSKPCSSL
jgi:hypothetical protein